MHTMHTNEQFNEYFNAGNIMYMFMPDQPTSEHKTGTAVAPFISRVNWHSSIRASTIGQSVRLYRENFNLIDWLQCVWLLGSVFVCVDVVEPLGVCLGTFPLSWGHADSQCSAGDVLLKQWSKLWEIFAAKTRLVPTAVNALMDT